MPRLIAGLLAWAIAISAAAQDERAALVARRQAVERQFAAEQADCAGRFAVNACSERARLKRRDALVALQQREAELGQRERKAAAARRQPAAKAQATTPASASASASAAASTPATPAPSRIERARPDSVQLPTGGVKPPRDHTSTRSAQEQRARAAFDQRHDAARAHRQKVEQRNARRAASGVKPSAPLPAPASASAPAR